MDKSLMDIMDKSLIDIIGGFVRTLINDKTTNRLEGAGLDEKDQLRQVVVYRVSDNIRIDIKKAK